MVVLLSLTVVVLSILVIYIKFRSTKSQFHNYIIIIQESVESLSDKQKELYNNIGNNLILLKHSKRKIPILKTYYYFNFYKTNILLIEEEFGEIIYYHCNQINK